MTRYLFPMVGLLVLFSTSTQAHDVWLTAELDGHEQFHVLVHHGHPGDRKRPDPDKLFDVASYDDQGAHPFPAAWESVLQDGNPILRSGRITLDRHGGPWMVGAQYDNGYWVKTEQGYRNTSKVHVPTTDDSLSSMKGAKTLVGISGAESKGRGSDLYQKVLGHPLELIPLANPFLLEPGALWRVRVVFDGQPLVGVSVEATDGLTPLAEHAIPRYLTNQEGVAEIPLPQAGPLLLVVDYEQPARHPDEAAIDRYNATLHVAVIAR